MSSVPAASAVIVVTWLGVLGIPLRESRRFLAGVPFAAMGGRGQETQLPAVPATTRAHRPADAMRRPEAIGYLRKGSRNGELHRCQSSLVPRARRSQHGAGTDARKRDPLRCTGGGDCAKPSLGKGDEM